MESVYSSSKTQSNLTHTIVFWTSLAGYRSETVFDELYESISNVWLKIILLFVFLGWIIMRLYCNWLQRLGGMISIYLIMKSIYCVVQVQLTYFSIISLYLIFFWLPEITPATHHLSICSSNSLHTCRWSTLVYFFLFLFLKKGQIIFPQNFISYL